MKVGDLIKHYRTDRMALVVRTEVPHPDRLDPRSCIEVAWLDDGRHGHGSPHLFIMVSVA